MKVGELIKKLEEFDKNLFVVYVSDTCYTEGEISYVRLSNYSKFPNEVHIG